MPIYKQETYSNKLLDFMREHKDARFTIEELVFFTGISNNRISAALFYLLRSKCVGVLPIREEMQYFALPEEMDSRLKVMRERKPEEPGSRKRRKKAIK